MRVATESTGISATSPQMMADIGIGFASGKTKPADMAREFEAMFLSHLIKEMRQTLEGEGLFPGDSGDVHGGLFDMYMSKHLADAGGIGLAAQLMRQMAEAEAAITPKTDGSNHYGSRSGYFGTSVSSAPRS